MSKNHTGYWEDEDGIKYDSKEKDPKYKKITKEAEKEAEKNLAHIPKVEGYCFSFWDEKKRILKEKYGIDWKTPAELNPSTLFD